MKRVFALTAAFAMILCLLFTAVSCGPKTYKYDRVEVELDAGEMSSSLGDISDQFKNSLTENFKDATITIDGSKVTLSDKEESKTLEGKKNGDRIDLSLADLGEDLTGGVSAAETELHVLVGSGATLVVQMKLNVVIATVTITAKVIFK